MGNPSTSLYDLNSALQVKPEVAKAFIILLSGSPQLTIKVGESDKADVSLPLLPSTSNPAESDADLDCAAQQLLKQKVCISDPYLAFAALTDGNVLDACFGGADKAETRSAKQVLRAASEVSESVAEEAIQAYIRCFRMIVGYNEAKKSIWLSFPFCWRQRDVKNRAAHGMKLAFRDLIEQLKSST
mmetsp:Transcript_23007/g.35488  ORF Transcript_23007/g.35488 Transcript_23007/m.35488 type:complete len:186 (+) Transcript_23007:307-864(+)|eukprot:CAMPEP_0196802308 /NCGR_PEP_ID=MMETSP1362-20130617/1938_1 /TAXON_ID=163516 /ORGANISM="Leptocylindrus danicus, Strain CCMP1856" /LENGTH=185 /DNA_ID=CAMNT_0042173565 /DNA_START=306 /DNA_END=863 /DNA_ORIENTATION=+